MLRPTGGPGTFQALTLSELPASPPGTCPSAESFEVLSATRLTVRTPSWPLRCLPPTNAGGVWARPVTCAPSCVVCRDRVPYRKDSGASACRISPPSGATAPLPPPAPPHRGLGEPAANTASPRCLGALLKVLAAQVGVTSLFPLSGLEALLSLRAAQSTTRHGTWSCRPHRCLSGRARLARRQSTTRARTEAGLGMLIRGRIRPPAPKGLACSI